MTATHYQTLELDAGAAPEDIRKAYRRLASRLHPDLLPEQLKEAATAEFVKVQLAFEELSDPARRAAYDKSLTKEAERQAAAAKPQPQPAKPKPPPKPAPQPKPEPAQAEPDPAPAAAGEPPAVWHIWVTFGVFLALAVAGYWIAASQIAGAESGWAKFWPVSWMAITFFLMCLACFEDGVLYSMFLTIGGIGLAAALLQGVSWTMLGVQLGLTLAAVGAVKLIFMFIADRRDELYVQLKPNQANA